MTSIEELVREYGSDFDEEKVRKTLDYVKNELISKSDELKDKGYDDGWKSILEPLREVRYIEPGFFGNLAQSLNDASARKATINFIKNIENSDEPELAYEFFEQYMIDVPPKMLLLLSHLHSHT